MESQSNKRKLVQFETENLASPSRPKKRARLYFAAGHRRRFRQIFDSEKQAVIRQHLSSQLAAKQCEIDRCLKDYTVEPQNSAAGRTYTTPASHPVVPQSTATVSHPIVPQNSATTRANTCLANHRTVQQTTATSRTYPPALSHPVVPQTTATGRTYLPSLSYPIAPQTTATTRTYTSYVSLPAVPQTTAQTYTTPVSVQSHSPSSPSDTHVEHCTLDSVVMVPFFRIADLRTNGHRYVCAAKYLGFYGISDERYQ